MLDNISEKKNLNQEKIEEKKDVAQKMWIEFKEDYENRIHNFIDKKDA